MTLKLQDLRMPTLKESLLVAAAIALIGFFSMRFYSPQLGMIGSAMRGDIVVTEDCPAPAIATFQTTPGTLNYDVTGARAAGYSDSEIVDYLAGHSTAPAAAPPFLCGVNFRYRWVLIVLVIFVAGCWFWESQRIGPNPT